jgi:pilus assembly protein CpaB
MSSRKLLLGLGVIFVGAGLWLALIWFNRTTTAPHIANTEPPRPAMLVAAGPIHSGTLLRNDDIMWREISPSEVRPNYLMRGKVSETEYLGAITRRDLADGEPLFANLLVKPSDRRFLAAVLRPNHRAVSISVDAPQTASGLVLPGDFVDVILTQNFGDNVATASHRSVGETVLHNVRVVAVDQSLGAQEKSGDKTDTLKDARVPKTITLEADERQAQKLFVAMQLGKLQLAVRPLEGSGLAMAGERRLQEPIWASDVSRAIREMTLTSLKPGSSGSTVERAVRHPPPRFIQ